MSNLSFLERDLLFLSKFPLEGAQTSSSASLSTALILTH